MSEGGGGGRERVKALSVPFSLGMMVVVGGETTGATGEGVVTTAAEATGNRRTPPPQPARFKHDSTTHHSDDTRSRYEQPLLPYKIMHNNDSKNWIAARAGPKLLHAQKIRRGDVMQAFYLLLLNSLP